MHQSKEIEKSVLFPRGSHVAADAVTDDTMSSFAQRYLCALKTRFSLCLANFYLLSFRSCVRQRRDADSCAIIITHEATFLKYPDCEIAPLPFNFKITDTVNIGNNHRVNLDKS